MPSFAGSWAFRVALRSVSGAAALVPAVVAASWLSNNISSKSSVVSCDKSNDNDNNNPEASISFSINPGIQQHSVMSSSSSEHVEHSTSTRVKAAMVGGTDDEHGSFHGLFPKRQLWQPAVPCK